MSEQEKSCQLRADEYARTHASLDVAQTLAEIHQYYLSGQLKHAQRLCRELLQFEPDNPVALLELGIICHRSNEWEAALECFLKLTELDPANDVAYYNLGRTAIVMQDWDMAFAAFSKTVELNPEHARACHNLGVILQRRGDLEQAVEYFAEASELDPEHALSRLHLVAALKSLQRLETCNEAIEDALTINSLSPDQRGELLVDRAINAWLQNDLDVCRRLLRLCKHVLPHMQEATEYTEPYLLYLIDLLEFRYRNPDYYQGECDAPIYCVGDSRVLAPVDSVVEINSRHYNTVSFLIDEVSVLGLLGPQKSHARHAFESAFEEIPARAYVVVCVGQSDCLLERGFYPSAISAEDSESRIKSAVQEFVEYVCGLAADKRLRLVFSGVAASMHDLQHLSVQEQQRFLTIIEQFNEQLSSAARAAGQYFLDVYTATLGENGRCNGQYQIDPYHLSPHALTEIFAQYLLAPDGTEAKRPKRRKRAQN